MKKLVTTLSALALASTLSFAEDKPPGAPREGGPGGREGGRRPNPEEVIKRLDTDNDGSISLTEFKAGPMAQRNPDRAEEMFKRIDKDGDGKVTLAEMKEARPPRPPGEGRGPGGEGKRGPKPGAE